MSALGVATLPSFLHMYVYLFWCCGAGVRLETKSGMKRSKDVLQHLQLG